MMLHTAQKKQNSKRFVPSGAPPDVAQSTQPEIGSVTGSDLRNIQSICCLSDNLYEGVIYSFNLDQNANVSFEKKLSSYSNMNQIFIFNPNYSAEKVLQNQKSAENDENDPTDAFNFFKIALDTQSSQKTNRKWRRKTLQEIKVDQNHSRVSLGMTSLSNFIDIFQLNLVKINMNSSEWKILRQWLEFGEISQIDQLIVKIHLHWSGNVTFWPPRGVVNFRSKLIIFNAQVLESMEKITKQFISGTIL